MKHNKQDNNVNKRGIEFKILMFMLIVLILYLFIADAVNMSVQITLLIILYFMLYVDHCNASTNGNHCDKNNTFEEFDSYKNREERIRDLNETRGKLGNFYVNCHSCGRKRILEERHKLKQNILKNCQSYSTPCQGSDCKGTCQGTSRGTCQGTCQGREHETMSFFNNRYVDKNQIFCYNCLMDNVHNDRFFSKNYVYWPKTNDPVNGPPYV